MKRFAIEDIIILNDFEAQSLALAVLGEDDLDPIGDGKRLENRARVVVGPGTGLGAGALVHGRNAWIPIPGEGGHIDLAPVSARDFALWPHLEKFNGTGQRRNAAVRRGASFVSIAAFARLTASRRS